MSDASILHPRVREALDAAKITFEELACEEHLADTVEFCGHYGIAHEDACNAILVVLKTTPRRYVACLVRADTRLDVNRKLSALAGVKRLSFASAAETLEQTGQMIGGVDYQRCVTRREQRRLFCAFLAIPTRRSSASR